MHNQHRITGHVRKVERAKGPVWYARIRTYEVRDGAPKWVQKNRVIGPAWTKRGRPEDGYFTQATADRVLLRMVAEEEEKAGKPQAAVGVTFAEAADEWLRDRTADGCRAHTLRDYQATAERLKGEWGEAAVVDITPQMVEAYKTKIRDTGVSPRTVNRHLVVAGGIFNRAGAKWGITHNPAAAKVVKRLREPSYSAGKINFLTLEQVEALVRATPDEQDAALFFTAAMTGLRQGELLALTWADVDFPRDGLHVRHAYDTTAKQVHTPKSGKVRTVPMVGGVATRLAALGQRDSFTADDDLVFPDWTGGHQSHMELRSRFYAALGAAGLKRIRFHDLRHTFATWCAGEGEDLSDIQAWMGHAHQSTTEIYRHYVPKRDAARRLTAKYDAAAAAPHVAEAVAS